MSSTKCPYCGNTNMQETISGYFCQGCEDESGDEHFYSHTQVENSPWDFDSNYGQDDEDDEDWDDDYYTDDEDDLPW